MQNSRTSWMSWIRKWIVPIKHSDWLTWSKVTSYSSPNTCRFIIGNKVLFWSTSQSVFPQQTKTIIHHSVGERGGYLLIAVINFKYIGGKLQDVLDKFYLMVEHGCGVGDQRKRVLGALWKVLFEIFVSFSEMPGIKCSVKRSIRF